MYNNKRKMGCESLIKVFFHMTTTIKLYHWQTLSYPRHKATCDLLLQGRRDGSAQCQDAR